MSPHVYISMPYGTRRRAKSARKAEVAMIGYPYGQTNLLKRERIKRQTIANRRLQRHAQAA
jgi:hypothetical protein